MRPLIRGKGDARIRLPLKTSALQERERYEHPIGVYNPGTSEPCARSEEHPLHWSTEADTVTALFGISGRQGQSDTILRTSGLGL